MSTQEQDPASSSLDNKPASAAKAAPPRAKKLEAKAPLAKAAPAKAIPIEELTSDPATDPLGTPSAAPLGSPAKDPLGTKASPSSQTETDQPSADEAKPAKKKKERKKKEKKPKPATASRGYGGFIRNSSSIAVSTILHTALVLILAFWAIDNHLKETRTEVVSAPYDERPEDEPPEIELEESTEPVEKLTTNAVSAAPSLGAPGASSPVAAPKMERQVTDTTDGPNVKVDFPAVMSLPGTQMVKAVPDGVLGDARAIVDNYEQAMGRITQEVMWMLDKGPVLIVWAFDQSESMEDDRKDIRKRVDRVYDELGLADSAAGDALLTSVTSYGSSFNIHTEKPTSDIGDIREAIDSIPNDASGKEMMCQAVSAAINSHKGLAKRRQMAVILVTDESGDPANNKQHLENAISSAKAANAKLYVLGREAVFGYPYAYMRWRHPQTNRGYWLQVDRGPETGFIEQLQTNGFWRRYDAFSSGFGPYEQARMARETNGIFFMLPTVEKAIVAGAKRRYQLDRMKAYRPDLRPRQQLFAERDKYPLRAGLWNVVYSLNPYKPEIAKIIIMRQAYSLKRPEFLKQANLQQKKAIIYLKHLAEVQKQMESPEIVKLREQEVDPRWQANYDLIYAQIVAYQARVYEYGAGLEEFKKKPKFAPATKPPNLTLVHWDIATRKQLAAPDKSQPYIDQASALFREVIRKHPGTPWAARAQWELNRGFGVHLVADYDAPIKKVSNPSPVPKL